MLRKPELTRAEIRQIKAVASELLATLKAERLRVDHWQDKEATRDAVWQAIYDHLYSDGTGLPTDCYTVDEVRTHADRVYEHVLQVYPTVPSPYYATAGVAV